MNEYLLESYLPAFANTVIAELGVAILLGCWRPRQLGAVALVNLATHPSLHLLLWALYWWREATAPCLVLLALEIVVTVAEGAMLRRWLHLPTGRALALAAAMNGTSCLIGWLLP
jgi:hypothetical protein